MPPRSQDQREAALDQFGAEPERLPGHLGQQPSAVVIDGAACRIIAVPMQEAIAPRLRDAALPRTVLELLQPGAGMVTLVGPPVRPDPLRSALHRRRPGA